MNWHKWTPEEDELLRLKFETVGDTKLAELFNQQFPKGYPWTKKHIEKRRGYLKLKRTPEQENRLRALNNQDGRQLRMWDSRGDKMKDGEIREWKGRKYIKVNGRPTPYFRHIANAKPGEVVRTHEGGIRIIDKKENQALNAKLRAERPSELKQTIKALNELKNILYGKENRRPQRNAF